MKWTLVNRLKHLESFFYLVDLPSSIIVFRERVAFLFHFIKDNSEIYKKSVWKIYVFISYDTFLIGLDDMIFF